MDRERLENLISDYLDRTLGPGELEALTRELRENPEARRLLLTTADQDSAVQELARSNVRKGPNRRAPRPRQATLAPLYWALLAVAVLLVAMLFMALGPAESGKETRPRPPKETEVRKIMERDLAEPRPKSIDQTRGEPARTEVRQGPEKQPANDQERIDREIKEAVERARKEGPASPAEQPEPTRPPPAPEPSKESKVTQGTVALVATFERIEGDVSILGKQESTPARSGQGVLPGQAVKSGPKGFALLKFADGTRLELGAETLVRDFAEEAGKRLFVEQGSLKAQVTRQPKGQPMAIATPHGEATVLGTTLRLVVDPDPKKGTRLEVEEGRVELRNRTTAKAVEVTSGHYATAATGVDLVSHGDASTLVPRKGLGLWVRADYGLTLNGSSVSAWVDCTAGDRQAVQPLAGRQPALVPDAIQGHPSLRFDGVDDCLTFRCPVTRLAGMSIFLVASAAEDRTGGITRAGNSAVAWRELENYGVVFLSPFQTRVHFGFGNGLPPCIRTYARPSGLDRSYSLTTAIKSLTDEVLFVNGRECQRHSAQNRPIAKCDDTAMIGQGMGDQATHRQFPGQVEGESFFSGEIAEILIYTRTLTEAERKGVEQYLLGKYFSK